MSTADTPPPITQDLYTHVMPAVGRDAADRLATSLGRSKRSDVYASFTREGQERPEGSDDHASLQVDEARPKGFEPLTF